MEDNIELEKWQNNEEYKPLRKYTQLLSDLDSKDFIIEYEYYFSLFNQSIEYNPNIDRRFEFDFYLFSVIEKRYVDLKDYNNGIEDLNLNYDPLLYDVEEESFKVNHLLSKFLDDDRVLKQDLEEFKKEIHKPLKKVKPLLIDGKIPNTTERYKIADEVFNIYDTINQKNISATEKHILLAHLMGCSQQTARELFNGTQIKRTPIRDEVVTYYLNTL